MSYGTELMLEMAIDDAITFNNWVVKQKENIKNKIWVTKVHQHLNISDMETSHIQNCINMLNKKCASENCMFEYEDCINIYKDYIAIMEDELLFREVNNWIGGYAQ